jgi:GGDEF domain-containing protein
MRSFRSATIQLLLFLAVFFVFGSFPQPENLQGNLTIQPYVFILAVLAPVLLMLFPRLLSINRTLSVLAWIILYLALKPLFSVEPFARISVVPLFFTPLELVFMVISIILTFKFIDQLHDVEDTIRTVLFMGEHEKAMYVDEAEDTINDEIYRSFRFKHPLSVVLIELSQVQLKTAVNRTLQDIQESINHYYVLARMGGVIKKLMRNTDLLFQQRSNTRMVLISPYTNLEGAKTLVQRIQEKARERFEVTVNVGISTMPEDAITFQELLRNAEAKVTEDHTTPKPVNN